MKTAYNATKKQADLLPTSNTDESPDRLIRKPTRIPGFAYDHGAYFVTICTKDRAPLFGSIVCAAPPAPLSGSAIITNMASAAKKIGGIASTTF